MDLEKFTTTLKQFDFSSQTPFLIRKKPQKETLQCSMLTKELTGTVKLVLDINRQKKDAC